MHCKREEKAIFFEGLCAALRRSRGFLISLNLFRAVKPEKATTCY